MHGINQEDTYHCRSCNSIQSRGIHSQKYCLKTQREIQQAKEDLEFIRSTFVAKNNLKRTSKSTIPHSEISIKPVDNQITSTQEIQSKKVRFNPAIDKKPRAAKRRSIAPIQSWYGPTHHHQTES